jgi:acetyl esterase/lipase
MFPATDVFLQQLPKQFDAPTKCFPKETMNHPLSLCTFPLFASLAISCAPVETAHSQSLPPSETISGVRIWRDIAYVSKGHTRQKLDFCAPSASGGPGPWPCVVFIHGGGWESGSKSGNAALGLCWRGYAVASISYRLSGDAPFPAQIEDCKAAVRYLRANAKRFNIDPNRIGASGVSAGGHLAALMGTTGDVTTFDKGEYLDQSGAVKAVVDFFGPTNLAFYGASRPGDLLSRLIGGPLQDNRAKVQAANPIAYISPGDAPFAIFHGDADPLVPLKHSEALRDALQKANVPVSLTVVRGSGHGFYGKAQEDVNSQVATFFDKHLK